MEVVEEFEYTKASRIAKIKVDKKRLNEALRDCRCAVIEDKRKQSKYSKRDLEMLLEEEY